MNILNTTKICTKCKIEKSVSSFNKNKATKDGINYTCKDCQKAYRQSHVEEISVRHKAYYKENVEQISEKSKAYRQSHVEEISEYGKAYYNENVEKILKNKQAYYNENTKKILKRNKAYRQSEMGKASGINTNNKRRDRLKQGDVSTKELLELVQNAEVCFWCNKSLKNNKVHVDHFYPLAKGGKHTISNLVISCASCNLRKGKKDPEVFAKIIGKTLPDSFLN